MDAKAREEMVKALMTYGDRSLDGLGRMSDEFINTVRSAPEEVNTAADFVGSLLPGAGALEGYRLANEASQQWRNGRYGRSIGTMADALDKTIDDAVWLIPGVGGMAGRMPR